MHGKQVCIRVGCVLTIAVDVYVWESLSEGLSPMGVSLSRWVSVWGSLLVGSLHKGSLSVRGAFCHREQINTRENTTLRHFMCGR